MRKTIPALAVIGGALIAFAAATTPGLLQGRGWIGLTAVETMLAIYAAIALTLARKSGDALSVGAPAGLIAGAVYAGEIALEYALTPADNTPYGLVEFGSVFAIFALAAGVAGCRFRRFAIGVSAAVWTAMISAVVWYAVLIAVFLAFRGSSRQALVFAAEGDLDDFRRAGGGDFARFIVQDFFGAGFYHLVLAPLVAAVLGSIGAGLGLLFARFKRSGGSKR